MFSLPLRQPLIIVISTALALSFPPPVGAALPAIVQITGHQAPPEGAELGAPVNQCLGFIVESEGFLVTNYKNLTNPANQQLLEVFRVALPARAGVSFAATIIGVEPTLNIGILKLEGGDRFEPSQIGKARPLAVGSPLSAVKAINSQKIELIEGAVVGLNTRKCYQENLTSTMFRAKIDLPENSVGGPVFFSDTGEVAALYTGYKPVPEPGHVETPGEFHLLPIDLCFNIYESIKQKGSLRSPWTGFSVRPLTDAETRHFPTARKHNGGVGIEHVWEDSPADKLGVKVGDILVQFGFNRIQSVGDFQKWLYMYGVGHKVKLVLLRNATDYVMLDYVIEERPQWAKPK